MSCQQCIQSKGTEALDRVCLQQGYTQFTPRFMVQRCLEGADSPTCQSNCINHGRYCTLDTIQEDLQATYNGRQVGC